MNLGILKRHEISFMKRLEIVFWEKMAKVIKELRQFLAIQGV